MNLIDNLTDDPTQLTSLDLGDGTFALVALIYRPTVQRWSMSVLRGTFEIDGLNLCVSPNTLNQWQNVIPFGIACLSADGLDPMFVDDFISGRISFYLLNAADVAIFESSFFQQGQIPAS